MQAQPILILGHMPERLVPADFEVPQSLETPGFRLRPLTIHDVVKDYDAVMTSADHLVGVFGDDSPWPAGLTLEQDLIDLGWHQKEFQNRKSFTYTVMSLDEARCLGCVYIYRSEGGADADVFLWARQSELARGLESDLKAAVDAWLREVWPFTSVRYPERRSSA